MKPIDLLQQICALPTAPFAEGRVVQYIEQFVRQRKNLSLQADQNGNLLIELAGQGQRRSGEAKSGEQVRRTAASRKGHETSCRPRWVFTAHMDHPGLVVDVPTPHHPNLGQGKQSLVEKGTVYCRFHGGVLKEYLAGAKVIFFEGKRQIPGKIIQVIADAPPRDAYPTGCVVRVEAGVKLSPGTPGMFDLTPGKITRQTKQQPARFQSRVCDDLAGVAAALAMIDQLHQRPATSPVAVLLTRAEEEGFIGAIGASQSGTLINKTDRLVAIEMSAEQPHAPQGKGPIIRVGDRASIFDSAITWFIGQQAQSLAKSEKGFVSQRALMPGGTCEATAYGLHGYSAGSICLALGNYHNMDRAKKKLAPEYIDLADWLGMVKLFVQVARHGHTYDPDMNELRGKLDRRFAKFSRWL